MSNRHHFLIVEDSEDDALMVILELRDNGFDPIYELVNDSDSYKLALEQKEWDIIICDYNIPGFGGGEALRILKETKLDVPFILLSGTIGEEDAVKMMKSGADDYIMKGNKTRLIPAIKRELKAVETRRMVQEAQTRAEKKQLQSEMKFSYLAANSLLGIAILQNNQIVFANEVFAGITGHSLKDILKETSSDHWFRIHPDDIDYVKKSIAMLESREIAEQHLEYRLLHKNGDIKNIEAFSVIVDYEESLAIQLTQIDITERVIAQRELMQALDRADFFVDLMGHDLSNINQAVSLSLELCLDAPSISEELEEDIEDALFQVKRSTELITSVKKFIKLEKLPPKLKPTDIEPILFSALKKVKSEIPDASIKFKTNITPKSFVVQADENLVDVFYALLSNAIKYSKEDSVKVDVLAKRDEQANMITVSCSDYGKGIPDELKDFLFSRIDKRKEGYWGSGVGLTLAKYIIDTYNGSIWIENRVPETYESGAKIVFKLLQS